MQEPEDGNSGNSNRRKSRSKSDSRKKVITLKASGGTFDRDDKVINLYKGDIL